MPLRVGTGSNVRPKRFVQILTLLSQGGHSCFTESCRVQTDQDANCCHFISKLPDIVNQIVASVMHCQTLYYLTLKNLDSERNIEA